MRGWPWLVLTLGASLCTVGCRTRPLSPFPDPAPFPPPDDFPAPPDFPAPLDLTLPPDIVMGPCPPPPRCRLPGSVDPGTGQCVYLPVPEGVVCDDGNPCTRDELCRAGSCVGGTPVVCGSDPCQLAGVCDPVRGCPQRPQGGPCDDGNPCTKDERCVAGKCSGSPVFDEIITHCLPWRAGWDQKQHALDYTASYMTWAVRPGLRQIDVLYHLVGGVPGSRHAIGANDFTGLCRQTLGQVPASGPCVSLTRENTTIANTVAFDVFGADIQFNGVVDSGYSYLNVVPGAYSLEFEVRVQAWGVSACPNCDVIYQAPGPYGHAVLIVIP